MARLRRDKFGCEERRGNQKMACNTGMLPLVYAVIISLAFRNAKCQENIQLSQVVSVCSNSTVISCSFDSVIVGVLFEDFDADSNFFNTLSSRRIAMNEDYEDFRGENVYILEISHADQYNGSLYRCFGFDGQFVKVFSNQLALLIPVCAGVAMNDTVTEGSEETSFGPLPEWQIALYAVLPITFLLGIVAAIGCIIAACSQCKKRCKVNALRPDDEKGKTVALGAEASESGLSADGYVADSNSPISSDVIVRRTSDEASAKVVTRLPRRKPKNATQRGDSDPMLQHPKTNDTRHPSSNTHKEMESGEDGLPAQVQVDAVGYVADSDSPVLPERSRDDASTHIVRQFTIPTPQNDSDHMLQLQKCPTKIGIMYDVSSSTHGDMDLAEDVPMQANPAYSYRALDVGDPGAQLQIPVRVPRLQQPTGTEQCSHKFMLRSESSDSSLPTPVQVDSHVADSSMTAVCVADMRLPERATPSTHVATRFTGHSSTLEIQARQLTDLKNPKTSNAVCLISSNTHRVMESGPDADVLVCGPMDFSDLQCPQVATNDAAGAIQLAGEVVKYDNVKLQLNRNCFQAHDLPMQGNPAYEPITPAQVQGHTLQRSTGAELSEDVLMQVNPAYETFGDIRPAAA